MFVQLSYEIIKIAESIEVAILSFVLPLEETLAPCFLAFDVLLIAARHAIKRKLAFPFLFYSVFNPVLYYF